MKVIDLLNKIAKGELPPQRIKFENYIYVWRDYQKDYFCKQINHSLESIIGECLFNNLNLEVEIIEEEKEIEELPKTTVVYEEPLSMPNIKSKTEYEQSKEEICDKINELVRELSRIKKEGK